MKRGAALALGLAMGMLLCGCGRELSHVKLIRVIGVDEAEGELRLVAVDGDEEPEVTLAQGEELSQAVEKLKGAGKERLELTHVTAVVLGQVEDPAELLWQQVKHRKSGYGATLWLAANGSAQATLEGADSPAERLRSLEENGNVAAPSLMDALRELTERGEVRLPEVEVREGEIQVVGWRTIRDKAEGGERERK